MTTEAFLRESFISLDLNDTFTEAVLVMRDDSRLCFHHRVGERWVKAEGASATENGTSLAGELLARLVLFRLNTRHLDIQFDDGSRWEAQFGSAPTLRNPSR